MLLDRLVSVRTADGTLLDGKGNRLGTINNDGSDTIIYGNDGSKTIISKETEEKYTVQVKNKFGISVQ